ncbi:MAG: cysteine hydrolase family protein [Immundisolibacter sp.]|uniref:cysteine hydrolase family protein n=1 Tax=Immundisolibacter sp. TaxID=1934948 RepID=UPI003D0B6C9A
MALTIDKSKTALLVMDVQNDITHPDSPMAQALGFAGMIQKTNMLAKLRGLMDACRAKGVPVIHVLIDLEAGVQPRMPHRGGFFQLVGGGNVCKRGTWGGDVADLVKPLPGETIVYKCIFSAFVSSGLQEVLDSHGITDVILSGVSTDAVVESTHWDACDRGYSNILAEDCCICATQEAHDITVKRMAGRCDVATAAEIIAALG